MLDQKSALILTILQKECHGTGYKVIDKSDILSSMPPKYRINEETLDHILTYLERKECIHIKYDDENVYCLCVTQKDNRLTEQEPEIKKEKPKMWLFAVLVMIFSLIGGFLGALIAKFVKF